MILNSDVSPMRLRSGQREDANELEVLLPEIGLSKFRDVTLQEDDNPFKV
jgi:hypothetical protein